MSHVVIETTVPVVVTSDDAHEPPVVVNAVQTTTVLVESEPEVIEVNAGPRGLPGPKGDKGEKGDAGGVPDAPLDGAAYARQSGAWVEALPASARGAAGGVASLGANGKLPESQLPAVAITDTYAVDSEAGMLALDAQRGDIAVRSDINKSFVLQAEPASTLANWLELRTPADAVLSVAGKTGAVSLVLADIIGLVAALAAKQATLVSGTNIKTIGGVPLLGAGDIPVGGAPATVTYTWNPDGTLATATEGGITSAYAWHADGRLNTITTPTRTSAYVWNAINPQQLDGVTVTGV